MAIITKPTNVYKNFENVYAVSVSELLLHPKVSVNTYFNDQSNWQTVFIVYKAVGSNQIENVEFEIAESQTTGLFEITDVARSDWEIQALFIQDFDRGYLRLEREDLDFASLDFTALPPPLEGVPTLNLVNISPVIANVNNSEVITLLFTSLESLQNVSATIAGQTAVVTGSGTSWQADYMLTGIEPAGNVSFTIDFQDILGQQGVTVTNTTDGSSTNIEYNQGSLSPVSIASNNIDSTIAVEGDTITVSFTASDTIQNVTSTIIGKTATVNNVSLNNWTASYTLTATEAQNTATFTINYEDQFGISQTQVTSVTDGSQVLIDTILPTLSPVSIASDNFDPASAQAGDIITVSFTSSETIQNVTGSILGNVATVSNISGNNWELSYTTSLGDTVGSVPFVINFQDSSLNSGVQVSSTTDGTSVTYSEPNLAPALLNATIYSDNNDSEIVKALDTITVDFTTTKPVDFAQIKLFSFNFFQAVDIGGEFGAGRHWSASATINPTQAASFPLGPIPLDIRVIEESGVSPTISLGGTTDASIVSLTDELNVFFSTNKKSPSTVISNVGLNSQVFGSDRERSYLGVKRLVDANSSTEKWFIEFTIESITGANGMGEEVLSVSYLRDLNSTDPLNVFSSSSEGDPNIINPFSGFDRSVSLLSDGSYHGYAENLSVVEKIRSNTGVATPLQAGDVISLLFEHNNLANVNKNWIGINGNFGTGNDPISGTGGITFNQLVFNTYFSAVGSDSLLNTTGSITIGVKETPSISFSGFSYMSNDKIEKI